METCTEQMINPLTLIIEQMVLSIGNSGICMVNDIGSMINLMRLGIVQMAYSC